MIHELNGSENQWIGIIESEVKVEKHKVPDKRFRLRFFLFIL